MPSTTEFVRLLDGALPFTASDGRAFIRVIGEYPHRINRTFAIRSTAFRDFFFALAHHRLDSTPSHRQWNDLCRHFEGVAVQDPERQDIVVSRRVAPRWEDNAAEAAQAAEPSNSAEAAQTAERSNSAEAAQTAEPSNAIV